MRSECECPKCGTLLVLKGGKRGEVKAKAKLFLTMQVERTYVCPKCSYEQKSQTLILK